MALTVEEDWLRYITCDDLGWHEYNVETSERREYYVHIEERSEESKNYFDSIYSYYRVKKISLPEKKIPLKYLIERKKEVDRRSLSEKGMRFLGGKKLYNRVCSN